MTANRPDDDPDDGEELPPELRELVESVNGTAEAGGAEAGAAGAGAAGTAAAADAGAGDELDTDPRVERFGNYAGVLVTAILGVGAFVGPWRLFDLTFSTGVPFEVHESTGPDVLVLGPLAMVFVGVALGAVYRATTDDLAEDHRTGLAAQVLVVQLIAAFVLFVLLLLVPVGEFLLAGDVVAALTTVVIAAVYLFFFTFFEVLGISLYVGIPTYVGVFLGDLIGRGVE